MLSARLYDCPVYNNKYDELIPQKPHKLNEKQYFIEYLRTGISFVTKKIRGR